MEHLHPTAGDGGAYHDPDYEAWVEQVAVEDEGVWWEEVKAPAGPEPEEPAALFTLDGTAVGGEWEEVEG